MALPEVLNRTDERNHDASPHVNLNAPPARSTATTFETKIFLVWPHIDRNMKSHETSSPCCIQSTSIPNEPALFADESK